MNYKLNVQNGKVGYYNRTNGAVVGSTTPLDSAMWLLRQGKPEKSAEIEGYPIVVTVGGSEYFFSGEWLMGGERDVLAEDPQKEPEKPKKRRAKDAVLE